MSRPTPQWHTVTRTLGEQDTNTYRAKIQSIHSDLEGAILLLTREHGSPVAEYLYGVTDSLNNAGSLAGFSVTPMGQDEEPELPDVQACAHPLIKYRSRLKRVGDVERMWTNYAGAREALEAKMPETGYLSVHFRSQGYFENKRIRNWIADDLNQSEDDSALTNALCARISVGAPSRYAAKDIARKSGEVLFPDIDNMGVHSSRPRFALFAMLLTLSVLTALMPLLHPMMTWQKAAIGSGVILLAMLPVLLVTSYVDIVAVPHEQTIGIVTLLTLYLWCLLLPAPWWLCLIPLTLTTLAALRWWQWNAWDDIMQAPRHYYWLNKHRAASDADNSTRSGFITHKTQVNAYGTQRSTLLIPSLMLASAITPSGDGQAAQQDFHPAARALTQPTVIPIGVDQNNRQAGILPENLYTGIAIFGSAGTGKSVLTHGIMQWADANRTTTNPKDWGANTRVIDFEMKDDTGVKIMQRYRRHQFNSDPTHKGKVSYLADPNSACIDLLGLHANQSASKTAETAGAALQYIYDEGDIRGQSLDIIKQALTIGIAMHRYCANNPTRNQQVADRLHSMEAKYKGASHAKPQATPIGWSLMAIAGADGHTGSARALGALVYALSLEDPNNMDMRQAALSAEQLYGQMDGKLTPASDKRLLEMTDASRNKIRPFMQCEHVFDPKRARITWHDVLSRAGDYHFVFTDRTMSDGTVHRLPERMPSLLGKWMMLTLWKEVTTTCQDWQTEGKHTMFVCDELSMLAGTTDSEILRQMKDQGRSFGWVNVFSTQYPEQLPSILLTSVCGYGTFIAFEVTDAVMASRVAEQLGGEEDGWTSGMVRKLPKYTVAMLTHADGGLQPACLLKVTDFDKQYR